MGHNGREIANTKIPPSSASIVDLWHCLNRVGIAVSETQKDSQEMEVANALPEETRHHHKMPGYSKAIAMALTFAWEIIQIARNLHANKG